MYSNVKSCVNLNEFNSDFFITSIGLMQGEVPYTIFLVCNRMNIYACIINI